MSWRIWYDDGADFCGFTWNDWYQLAKIRPDHGIVKMIYHSDGTKQIQTADWFVEIPHEKGVIRRTCSDEKKSSLEEQHPDAVFVEGFWTVDEWFKELVSKAHSVKAPK